MNKIYLGFLFFCFFSCDFFEIKTREKNKDKTVIASVYDVNLYLSDISNILRSDISKQDSIILVKNYINSWARKQLLLKKAEENVTEGGDNEINLLVKKYKESLYINRYKERLIKQQLDTVIGELEITNYYNINKNNFRLNEKLFKLDFIYFGKDFLDKKETIKLFESEKESDKEKLDNLTINFKDFSLHNNKWMTFDQVVSKIPPLLTQENFRLLKKSKFIKKEDSLGVYLVAIKKVLARNEISPLSYTKNKIKQIILHKRKLELIRDIEKTLIDDAIKSNKFKEY